MRQEKSQQNRRERRQQRRQVRRQKNCLDGSGIQLDRIPLLSAFNTFCACILASVFLPPLAAAAGTEVTGVEPGLRVATPQLVNSPLQPAAPDYSRSTDHELTRLGARWDALSAPEREALLREVKLRMAQRKDPDGVLMIQTQRRYGRVYRGNGRYLKIETKVIRVRPSSGTGSAGFGTGFEQRNSQPASRVQSPLETPVETPAEGDDELAPLDAAMSPPVMRASDPSS